MKIKTKSLPYEKVMALPRPSHKKPLKPNKLLHTVVRIAAIPDLLFTRFSCTRERMDLVKGQPCLILMNHSSFIDLKIASAIFYPKPYSIVCTTDAYVGKSLLMRLLGCIPTKKYVSDVTLINDMRYALKELDSSVLMYPEAGYSFDGTSTALPKKLGLLAKRLDVPVVSVITQGAFHRDPLYNCLQLRKVKVSAHVKCLLTQDEVREKSISEIDKLIDEEFSFDNFAWQQENEVKITEPFRADGLNRIIYKCAACRMEGKMEGKGTQLTCHHCGKTYELDEVGRLKALEGETEFPHIPDWYKWERECVRQELERGEYKLDVDVDIGMLVDYKAFYEVGHGRLVHDSEGFHLTGCEGKLDYHQKPRASYSLNADYYWYEKGDIICIGTNDELYYCIPRNCGDVVAKTRLATEELYKMARNRRRVTEE